MWDFFETVRHRHSVRKYQADMPVEPEKLHAILEMACAAPSAGDLQAYRIIVVQDAETRAKLADAPGNHMFIDEAPVNLIFCSDSLRSAIKFGDRGAELYSTQDATIAAAYAQLAAVAAGLASSWIGDFDDDVIRRILQIDAYLRPVALLTLGYPAELPAVTTRRRMDDVVLYHGRVLPL